MTVVVKPRRESKRTVFVPSKLWFPFFAAITIIAAIVPIRPEMPRRGFDPSWMMPINEAVATHMRIGHDVIFTFGPYSSVYTELYHPVLDHLIILSSLIFALAYLGATLYLIAGRPRGAGLVFLVFLGWILPQVNIGIEGQLRDALFFSYPLMLSLCAVKLCTGTDSKGYPGRWETVFWAILCIPLGLLPLVKGNMIVECGVMILLIAAYLLYQKCFTLAVTMIVVPVLSLFLFWFMAGQPLQGLSDYALSSFQMLAGYAEAMGMEPSSRGIRAYVPIAEIMSYLIGAAAILWALTNQQSLRMAAKLFLALCFALFLFVGFKSGFVRHDHASIAFSCLLFASIFISFWGWDRKVRIALALSGLMFVCMLRHDVHIREELNLPITTNASRSLVTDELLQADTERKSTASLVNDVVFGVYGRMWNGIRGRLFQPGRVASEYQDGLTKIASAYPVPNLHGSMDIYPIWQTYVLSSPNKWDPRPIFHSYAAFTPRLALLNEQHLRISNAPDYVLFEILPLDQRLPSLDDGVSWTAFLDNYRVVHQDSLFVYLRRTQLMKHSDLSLLQEGTYKIGQNVSLPAIEMPLFAEVDLEPTLWGKLVNILFKPTQVRILLTLSDGSKRDYRVLPNMMKTGFLVSPLVEETKQFSEMIRGERSTLPFVKEVTIVPYHPGWKIWQDHYTVKFKEYRGGAWNESVLSK